MCAVFSIVYQVLLAETKVPGSLPRLEQQFSEPYFALSLSTGIMTTGMIVFRVWQVQKLPAQSPDGRSTWSRAYSNITEIVIESAALNSASLFVTFVLFVLGNVNLDYMQSVQSQISVRCFSLPLEIILICDQYRVWLRRSYCYASLKVWVDHKQTGRWDHPLDLQLRTRSCQQALALLWREGFQMRKIQNDSSQGGFLTRSKFQACSLTPRAH